MALLREVIELPHARVVVEQQPGLLFIVETGQIKTLAELGRYIAAIDSIVKRTATDRAVIDARGEVGDPPLAVREAMWSWILDPHRGFSILAFVLPTEMAIARVNMTALSQGAKVRAFDSVIAAQRWIARGPRFSTQTMRTPSSRPPPMEPSKERAAEPPAGRPRRDTARGPGFYSSTAPAVDRTPPQGSAEPPTSTSRREPDKGSATRSVYESDFRTSDFRTRRPLEGSHGVSHGASHGVSHGASHGVSHGASHDDRGGGRSGGGRSGGGSRVA
jgi:hypothetical protein